MYSSTSNLFRVLGLLLFLSLSASAQRTVPVSVDVARVSRQLPALSTSGRTTAGTDLLLPTLEGDQRFSVVPTPVVPFADALKQPDIRTFSGVSQQNPDLTCRITLSRRGLHVQYHHSGGIYSLDPTPDGTGYQLETDSPVMPFGCQLLTPPGSGREAAVTQWYSYGGTMREYKLALLLTHEFYVQNGNTDASVEAAIQQLINDINGFYTRTLSIRFTLVSPLNNAAIHFYHQPDATLAENATPVANRLRYQSLDDAMAIIPTDFGAGNYDLAHVIHNSGGGIAYLNSACVNQYKAGGWSGVSSVNGFQRVFIHEMGHKLGTPHTFNGVGQYCTSQRSYSNAYEPGSGASIMAYPGLCDASQNLINTGNINFFHVRSVYNIASFVATTGCAVTSATGNQTPQANGGPDYVIPRQTPFVLTGSATDADGDPLTYNWEQYDISYTNAGALGSIAGANGKAAVNDVAAPLFRSYAPSTSTSRTFPSLPYVLGPNPDQSGEALSAVGRTMHFRFTAYDNKATGGSVGMDDVNVVVDSLSGPFRLTSQNTATLWQANGPATITWDVSRTNLSPISCANVKISFSTDGGLTYPIILAAGTPNDGSEVITIPNLATTTGRIKVEAVGNIFFDVNDRNISITTTCTPEYSTIQPADPVVGTVGSAHPVLTAVGKDTLAFAGTLNDLDVPLGVSLYANNGACNTFSNTSFLDLTTFRVTQTGTYTLSFSTASGLGLILSVFQGTYDASSPCSGFLKTTANLNASNVVVLSNSLSLDLTAGVTYSFVLHNYGTGYPNLPASYTISASSATGGRLTPLVPGSTSPYAYTYIAVSGGTIKGFSTGSDFSNASAYPAGSYQIYGLSYAGGTNLSGYVNTSFSAFQSALSGFCGKLSANTVPMTITVPASIAIASVDTACRGVAWEVAFNATGGFSNPFQVQLSDAAGIFGGGMAVVGSGATSPVTVTLPDTLPTGSTYRLRVVNQSVVSAEMPLVVGEKSFVTRHDGLWTDPQTWSCHAVPTIADDVVVQGTHVITVPDNTTVLVRQLLLGGTVHLGIGALLNLAP